MDMNCMYECKFYRPRIENPRAIEKNAESLLTLFDYLSQRSVVTKCRRSESAAFFSIKPYRLMRASRNVYPNISLESSDPKYGHFGHFYHFLPLLSISWRSCHTASSESSCSSCSSRSSWSSCSSWSSRSSCSSRFSTSESWTLSIDKVKRQRLELWALTKWSARDLNSKHWQSQASETWTLSIDKVKRQRLELWALTHAHLDHHDQMLHHLNNHADDDHLDAQHQGPIIMTLRKRPPFQIPSPVATICSPSGEFNADVSSPILQLSKYAGLALRVALGAYPERSIINDSSHWDFMSRGFWKW